MSEIFYLGFSAPLGDQQNIDRLVREITASLPLGITLDSNNRQRLSQGPQPRMIGTVDNRELTQEDFAAVFEIACSSVEEEVGVKLIVGQEGSPRLQLMREAEIVRAQSAPKKTASDLLYGQRRL